MIFTNAQLVFADRIQAGSLRVRDRRIAELGPALAPEPTDEVVDLVGQFLAPGFIDLHIH